MSEQKSNTETPESYLRRGAERELYEGKTTAEMLGVISSRGVFGNRDRVSDWQAKTRIDIDGSSHAPGEGYQTLSFRTYRDNVPRWDVSRTGEVFDHEEAPTAIFWQDNTGKAASEAGPVYQYGSEVPLGSEAVEALARTVNFSEPMREVEHTRHAL